MVNPFPDDKILGLSKLKAFADDKLNITQTITAVAHCRENIVGKEENADYQHFLLFFPQCFQKAFSSGASKVVILWWKVNVCTMHTNVLRRFFFFSAKKSLKLQFSRLWTKNFALKFQLLKNKDVYEACLCPKGVFNGILIIILITILKF